MASLAARRAARAQPASRSASAATSSASTALASTRARAFASSSRARSSAASWSRTSTSSRSRARGSLAIGPRRLERARLLVDLERRRVAHRTAASRAAPCRRARRAAPSAGRSERRALPLWPACPLPAGRSSRPNAPSCFAVSAWACLSSASISERPRSRRSISTSRSCSCICDPRRSQNATRVRISPIPAAAAPRYSGASPTSMIPSVAARNEPPATTRPTRTSRIPTATRGARSPPARRRT